MVLYTVSNYVTHWMAPRLFRVGIALRNHFPRSTSYTYDFFCGLPMAQTMLSLKLYDESTKRVAQQQQQQSTADPHHNPDERFDLYASMAIKTRLKVLQEHLRPALTPNNLWSDVHQWNWNLRILKWVRQEVLIAKYGPLVKEALDAYPQLRMSPQLSRHPTQRMLLNLARGRLDWQSNDNSNDTDAGAGRPLQLLLPSSDTLKKAFSMQFWATTKQSLFLTSSLNSESQAFASSISDSSTESATPNASIAPSTSMEEILDYATGGSGGPMEHCGPFNTVCEEAEIYQLWTREYIQHLGTYLMERAREHQSSVTATTFQDSSDDPTADHSNNNPPSTLVLDVGAGDGLLLHYLQEYYHKTVTRTFKKRGGKLQRHASASSSSPPHTPAMEFIATDDGSWRIFAKAKVEKLNVTGALDKYALASKSDSNQRRRRQVIVICSWMPMEQDWTHLFRDAEVDEYILIGEADDGSCGHNWKTWGNIGYYYGDDPDPIPLYQLDGYRRWDMDALAPFQFSRFDCVISKSGKTVSFQRLAPKK